jgi:predicted porin
MQKKIIALAVAGLVSGAVFAQSAPSGTTAGAAPRAAAPTQSSSSVTLYGRADLGYVYSKSDYKKFQGIDSGQSVGGSPSRIGVRGEENLGNGLKAIYRFEWGIMADEGGAPGAHAIYGQRYTWVGLSGNFGDVSLGRHGTPSEFALGGSSPFFISGLKPTGQFRSKLNGLFGELRWNNSIAYNSPKFSGLDFIGVYSFGEKTSVNKNNGACDSGPATTPANYGVKCADTSDAGKLGLAARYANGPLYLTVIYEARADDDSVSRTAPPAAAKLYNGYGAKAWAIGGSYDFKVVKLFANYFREKANHGGRANIYRAAPGNANADVGSDKQSVWSVGATIPVSQPGTVFVEYAQYKDYLEGGVRPAALAMPTAIPVAGGGGHKSKGFMIGYRHNLSRRTFLYTYATQFKNDDGITGGYTGNSGANNTKNLNVAGEKQNIFVAGIVHNF